ncbi:hypothetical protein CANTEDRAFT_93267 [Yamadazyma tenuis ATCC 10573]|uniref:BRCT domain-containing protein n=1 Tax=Candida tenuis (strain ATCC 10573 / BCRC 21748 / CBS 615 / JCM 9827 / NBRC 10315 / NRRL Y-1498 / VKM Y-70) TaxID=590646 RepID=G3B3W8_CANTC|nr:uncharacterized protein CANTEDRAFT_93267 [Yamadazyma tenuis ATCC 10573]EGV63752.1 hypothetical protein CANTEDRAFT_93267 [Yamadazyma tenuis ATCC 10573]
MVALFTFSIWDARSQPFSMCDTKNNNTIGLAAPHCNGPCQIPGAALLFHFCFSQYTKRSREPLARSGAGRSREQQARVLPLMLPLTGKCFCCTAISSEARDTVERQVVELGGTYTLDLMSHTTHLVVGDTRTAKYRYCVRHRDDVKILQPTAIGQFYEAWRRGRGDTTTIVPAASPSLDSFVLPTFYGLAICVGHFRSDSIYDLNGDNTSPAAVRALIERHGGTATDSLTNAHAMLLSNIPTGKRYTKAVEWRLPVVHPLYVLDSLRRGASLDPDDYAYDHYPEIPRNSDAPTSGGDPPSMAVSAAAAVARTDSAPAKIRKNLDVWNSLVHREHTTTSGGSHSTTTDAMSNWLLPSSEIGTKRTKTTDTTDSIFQGITFHLSSFTVAQTVILSRVIVQHGGSTSGDADYVLVPFGTNLRPMSSTSPVRTEWLVERSIYYGRLTDDAWSHQLADHTVSGAVSSASASLSGFKGIEHLHLTKLCRHLGMEVSDSFNANIDMLVVNINIFKQRLPESLFERPELVECAYNSISRVSTKNKIVAAKKWKIPVVSPWYLFELANDSDPSIKDLKWCLYYSKKQEPDSGSDSLRLPSPKKIRRRFGKLVTNSKELELQTSKTHEDSNDEDEVRIGYDSKRQKK